MRKKSVYRGVLIIAGFLAVAVIILSHSFSQGASDKAATEQTNEKQDKNTTLTVPAEAVTQASVVKIDEQSPDSVLETLSISEVSKKYFPSTVRAITKLFRVLFQTVIAPNAP